MEKDAPIRPSQILVTGGQGRLGQALAAKGCTALGRNECDISDESSISAALEKFAPALVINAVAYTSVDKAEEDEAAVHALNVAATGQLAAMCDRADIPVLQISTDCVFGDHDPQHPVGEDAEPVPQSVYANSKLKGEREVLRLCPAAKVARVSWLFDEGADTFIGKILAASHKRDTLKVVDEAHGRPTPVGDLAGHLIKLAGLMVSRAEVPDILHLGPPGAVSRYEWATEIFAASTALGGPNPQLEPCPADAFPEPARRPRGLVLDVSRADALLGPMPNWRPACREAVRALLS